MADATGAEGGPTDRAPERGPRDAAPRGAIVRALALVAGGALLASAALYHPPLLAGLRDASLSPLEAEKVARTRAGFALAGLALVAAAEAIRRWRRAAVLAERPWVVRGALAVWAVALPLGIADCALRPFMETKTTLFQEDAELGWRLRPGARAEWGGVRVTINAQGLRGPALARPKPPGVDRLLFLGDSVTFGYGLTRAAEAFPARTAAGLSSAGHPAGHRVEAVNAGVGGWSPWQQARFLEREGWAYEPDVLVVGFVLNDVTEKLSLVRFGGEAEGWQLLRTARGRVDRWLSGSAVATWLRDTYAVLRFGADVRGGALRAEAADVKRLAAAPDARAFARAWRITLANLASIFDAARAREVPALLVVFPYRFQLDAPGRSAGPQRRLRSFAEERDIPFLDLLPAFVAGAAGAEGPDALFLDASHPSAAGHRLASEAIARSVRARGWLARREPARPEAPAGPAGSDG